MKTPKSALQVQRAKLEERQASQMSLLAVQKRASKDAVPRVNVQSIINRVVRIDPARLWRVPRCEDFHFRTRDIGRITTAVVKFAYQRYPAPDHLEMIWRQPINPLDRHQSRMIAWYISVASGESLYKQHTSAFLTRKETHRFLTAARTNVRKAIIFAIAGSYTDNLAVCHRLSQSKIGNHNLIIDEETTKQTDAESRFWRDVIRFLSLQQLGLPQINDLVDFFTHCREQDSEYSLKGRTLASVGVSMEQWHRGLARERRLGNHTWEGLPVENRCYERAKAPSGRVFDYQFQQITTSKDLAAEGSAMHHCVYSYQPACIGGRTSIWSVRSRAVGNPSRQMPFERCITFEVNITAGAITQIRGYANRTASPDEVAAIKKFASENNLRVDSRR